MAKEFVYRQDANGWCLDECAFTNNEIKIGSRACCECEHNQHIGDKYKVVTCPKIMKRSTKTGKVIMRKPK